MKKTIKFSLHILAVIFIFQSCSNLSISNLSYTSKAGEKYDVKNKKGVIKINSFSLDDNNGVDSLGSYADRFILQTINGDQLQQILQANQYTWVAMWSIWCGPCIEQLPTYQKKASKFGLKLVLICSDYQVNKIDRRLKYANFKGVAYVLDNTKYLGIERDRVMAFRDEIYPDCASTRFAMPHHYLFEGNKIVYFTEGSLKTDSIQAHLR